CSAVLLRRHGVNFEDTGQPVPTSTEDRSRSRTPPASSSGAGRRSVQPPPSCSRAAKRPTTRGTQSQAEFTRGGTPQRESRNRLPVIRRRTGFQPVIGRTGWKPVLLLLR